VLAAAACGGDRQARTTRAAGSDPCALLSRAEAEQVLGPLRHDPYRVDGDDAPTPDGGACRFETATGRHLVMDVNFEGAQIGMRVIGIGAQLTSPVFGSDSARIAALQGRRDEARLLPGHLMASLIAGVTFCAVKHDVMLSLDLRTVPFDQARAFIAMARERL
jgi:hypothetical protein